MTKTVEKIRLQNGPVFNRLKTMICRGLVKNMARWSVVNLIPAQNCISSRAVLKKVRK
jgi:hypothetical protein